MNDLIALIKEIRQWHNDMLDRVLQIDVLGPLLIISVAFFLGVGLIKHAGPQDYIKRRGVYMSQYHNAVWDGKAYVVRGALGLNTGGKNDNSR